MKIPIRRSLIELIAGKCLFGDPALIPILVVQSGSQAYGMATPESDYDFKGFAVAPMRTYLGFSSPFHQRSFSDADLNAEGTIYDIKKFFALAADCNPNIIEVLFTPENFRLWEDQDSGGILAHRDLFVTKKARWTFAGYAFAQLKRIKNHRRWVISPPTHKPTREEYALTARPIIPKTQLDAAEASIQKQINRWEFRHLEELDPATRQLVMDAMAASLAEITVGLQEKAHAAGRLLGFDDNFIEYLDRERHYKTAKHEWDQYQKWITNRNPARAAMEAKFGYDGKHASHLVRLMRMCGEILSGKGVIVHRPDADELLSLRHGAWSYDELIEWAERQEATIDELYRESTLPNAPDKTALDGLCMGVIERVLS